MKEQRVFGDFYTETFCQYGSEVPSQQNLILHWKMVKQKAFGDPGQQDKIKDLKGTGKNIMGWGMGHKIGTDENYPLRLLPDSCYDATVILIHKQCHFVIF